MTNVSRQRAEKLLDNNAWNFRAYTANEYAGIEAEAGGTAMNQTLTGIGKAVAELAKDKEKSQLIAAQQEWQQNTFITEANQPEALCQRRNETVP